MKAGSLVVGLFVALMLPASSCAEAARRPNILLLVAEDLSPRIGAYGDAVASTPNLDQLAQRSVRFTHAFTTAGVCAPSRAALIMGQHQISFGAQHMRTSSGPLGEYYAQPDPDLKAFPELLRRAGYFTFTDSKLDYQFSGVQAGSGPFTIWDEEGVKAHWRNRGPGQPFFGLINFLETHESGVMRLDVEPHNAAHGATQKMRKTYGLVAPEVTSPADIQVPPYYPDIPEVRADMARHYDNIHAMDARVGSILRALEQDGLGDNTIVIWTADHGDGLPRAKRELLDTGIHVPMLVHVPTAYQRPGWKHGEDRGDIVSFVDFAPTILGWAGVEAPARLHGSSFLNASREFAFASRDRIDTVGDRQRAVRDRRYKYIRSWSPETPGGHALAYRDGLEMVRAMRALFRSGQLSDEQARWFEAPGEEQLYDLHVDPAELNNLADDPGLVDVRARLRNALIDWLARVGDTSIVAEERLRDGYLQDGEIPVTAAPTVRWLDSELTVIADGGASVGYRTDAGPWRLYVQPVQVAASTLEVKAVRYGWRESPVVELRQSATMQAAKPNIVILFADDLGYGDLASYGHPYIRTPNLDALAAEGQRWTDFYVAAPVCSPSRGALLTGKLPMRTGLFGRQINVMFPNDTAGMPADERTLAEAVQEEGYATAIVGKWHLGDAPDALPTRHGFDYWYGLPYSNDMDWVGEKNFDELMAIMAQGRAAELQHELAARQAKYFDPKIEYWNVPLIRSVSSGDDFADEVVERPADQRTLTRRYTEEAIGFIERSKDQPFLLYLPYSMPHTPIFRSDTFVDNSLGGRYGDVIEELDWSVGEIVAKLRALGLAENTLVLFTSDNGPWLTMNQHGGSAGLLKHGKGTTFEGGMRVPGIFWWPGAIEPGVVSDIGSTLDVYSTALSLAGASPSAGTDGLDLTDTLLRAAPSPRNTMAYYRGGELRAFRKGAYKLHLITEGAYRQPPKRTVHDDPVLNYLADDPAERFDVSAQHPEVVADLLQAVDAHRAAMTEQPPIFDRRLQAMQP